jgi:hypothetical protein
MEIYLQMSHVNEDIKYTVRFFLRMIELVFVDTEEIAFQINKVH